MALRKTRTDAVFETAASAHSEAPTHWVCLALLLALVTLAARIASIW
ncbi:hypothetical protein Q2941_47555 [Bradyrhizobium sp. UFLA05-153]|nr:hypothetical protein [Bradyrhizobium sp. Ec3.3]